MSGTESRVVDLMASLKTSLEKKRPVAQHTPRPWHVEQPTDGAAMVEGALVLGPENQPIAEILSADAAPDARFATYDGALIAAAPDLLESLRETTDILSRIYRGESVAGEVLDAIDMAHVHIRRATDQESA